MQRLSCKIATSGMQPDRSKTHQPKGRIMNNHKFFRNAALAFGLMAAASSFAAETNVPAAKTPEQREAISTEIRSKMANMTPAQREAAYRVEMQAKMSKMTPEQRETFRTEIRSEMANKTPEQREAFRAETKAKMDKMTPEQRAEMQGKMHEAMAEHDAKGEGHEHGAMRHENMHTGDMHAAGGMHAR
jgi:Protein of unknown function (DUF3106)